MFGRLAAALALFIAMAFSPSQAMAAWHKAESDRFVIYSDSRPEDLRYFGEILEKYHIAMELESGRKVPVPSPSNRLTVYMVGGLDDLRDIYGNRNSNVAGFYLPRAVGSVTFVPNINLRLAKRGRPVIGTRVTRRGGYTTDFSLTVLLHEYAHHFLIASARHAMPRWLTEGSAEYFASARFNDDGTVDIGLPNNNRAYEISQAAPVSLEALLDYDVYRKNRSRQYDAYYGRSWLLYHYLRFNPARRGQLSTYWEAVASGMDSLKAGEQIFGDLKTLEKELAKYGRERSMAGMRFSASDIAIGTVTTTQLSDGHADMMDVITRSKRGVGKDEASELAAEARKIAERYPEDSAVMAALAEAEYDAGNDDAAIAAADRAIAINAQAKNAYVQKGFALFRKAAEAAEADSASASAAYDSAMRPFEALNAIEPDHTMPLIYYYRSFAQRGGTVPDDAKFALERATQLAPFDKDLALEVATMKANEGDTVIATYLLRPVAANPHGGKQARLAQAMIDYLDKVPQNTRVNFQKLIEAAAKAKAEAGEDDAEEGEEEGGEEAGDTNTV